MEFLTVSVSIILEGTVSNSGKTVGQYQRVVDRNVYSAWGSYIHNIICQQTAVNEDDIKIEWKAHFASKCKHQAPHV